MHRQSRFTLMAAAALALFGADAALACTSLVVGKQASSDGSLIVARNEDYYINNWNKREVIHPRRDADKDEQLSFKNGLKVPAPKTLYRYTGLMDWNGDTLSGDGLYEERGVNEFNVAVSASNSAQINKQAAAADPLVDSGVIEAAIPSLILPQAKSAREGVALLGRYIQQYGAGEGNGVLIADPDEAWYLEIGSGHHWLAYRVPQDRYLIVANGLRLHGLDLHDQANVLSSPGLADFVRQHKLLPAVDERAFNFAKAFGVTGDPYNVDREWLAQHRLTPSLKQATRQDQYPLLQKPDHKLSVADVAGLLRADFSGTPLAKRSDAERPIGMDRTIESHIFQLRADLPKPFAVLTWQSFGSPAGAVFVPMYENALRDVAAPLRAGSAQYEGQSAYWAFRGNATLAQTNPAKYGPVLRAWQSKAEGQLQAGQPHMDAMLKQLYAANPETALGLANQWSNGVMLWAVQSARDVNQSLLTDMTKASEKKYSPDELEKIKNL
ncbi:C69 family dipeptidase [Chromobacterium alticapitis]|uniref:Dipeptidase n=1 Tax=Chromobacterium alticapitis TaxID=2073169 RepID=A0A2S5DFH4_9NEIS|nr:C69 family dipeptidase [Chromobacterium alticapitis]POZ61761.1 dipeptidase [Chromobacterium alticapitis]